MYTRKRQSHSHKDIGRNLRNVYPESLKSNRKIGSLLFLFVFTLRQLNWRIPFSIGLPLHTCFLWGITAYCRLMVDLEVWDILHSFSVPGHHPKFFSIRLLSVTLLSTFQLCNDYLIGVERKCRSFLFPGQRKHPNLSIPRLLWILRDHFILTFSFWGVQWVGHLSNSH